MLPIPGNECMRSLWYGTSKILHFQRNCEQRKKNNIKFMLIIL
jgi:hypothetical protein